MSSHQSLSHFRRLFDSILGFGISSCTLPTDVTYVIGIPITDWAGDPAASGSLVREAEMEQRLRGIAAVPSGAACPITSSTTLLGNRQPLHACPSGKS